MYHCTKCKNEFESDVDIDSDFSLGRNCKLFYTAVCMYCGGEIVAGFVPRQSFNIGNKEYGQTKWSDSLAMNPCQIEEHKRLFPDIKIDGQGRPGFDNYQQHKKYLKATGFEKKPQKIKNKGKNITPKKATAKA